MRITGATVFGPQKGLMNVHCVNQSVLKQPAALQQGVRAGLRSPRDTVSLSPYGKANRALSGLEKLKQQIEDRRSEYISKATEEGQSADVIQAQLDSFDQQIKDIDQQITQMTIQQTRQGIEKAKHTANTCNKRAKTRQEVENERLANITSMSAKLDSAGTIRSVKTQVDGAIGIKESEIELEKGRNGATEQMEAELSELQNRSNQLTAEIGDQFHETLEEIQESHDTVAGTVIVDTEKTEDKDGKDEVSESQSTVALQSSEVKKDSLT